MPISELRFVDNYKTPVDWSVNNLSHAKRTSIKQGLHTPVMFEKCYSTDKFDVEFASKLQTNPLVAPLMGDFTLRFATFKSDLSNYYGWLDNNERVDSSKWLNRRRHYISGYIYDRISPGSSEVGNYRSILPVYFSEPDYPGGPLSLDAEVYKRICVQPGSLLDFLGITPGFIVPTIGSLHHWSDVEFVSSLPAPANLVADKLLVYLDVVRNYMVNNQYEAVPYLSVLNDNPNTPWTERSSLAYISLNVLDYFFKLLRMEPDGVDLGYFVSSTLNQAATLAKYGVTQDEIRSLQYWFSNVAYGGLFCAQFANDMMQNLLQKVGTDNVQVSVDPESGSFTIVDLRFKNKLQHLTEDIQVSGGRPDDVNNMLWHSDGYGKLDIPQLVSVTSFDINPTNTVSTANTSSIDGGADLGQMASRVDSNDFVNNFNVSTDWDCVLMNIVTLIPKIDYYEGLDKDLDALMFADDFKPQFNQLGFQDVPYYRYNCLPSGAPTPEGKSDFSMSETALDDCREVVGKTVSFINMRSNVNRLHGQLSNYGTAQTWALGRTFRKIENDRYLNVEFSPYVNPADFQYPFVETDVNVDNFYLQVGYKIRAVRPISNQARPTLE